MTPDQIIMLLAAIFGSGGIGSFFGVKASLNGQKERLVRVEEKVDRVVQDVAYLKGQGNRQEDREMNR